MFVDSHCHLSFPELRERLPELLAAMRAAQVEQAVCIGTTLEEAETVLALAASDPALFATVGVHPDNEGVSEPDLPTLLALAARPKVVAVGETGLDYYRLNGRSVADMAWQRARFAVHLAAARATGLPAVVHTRAAAEDTVAMLREAAQGPGAQPLRGVLHCFTETLDVARAVLDLGWFISFSGILTFKNAAALREVAAYVPLERTLIETDSPYLAPVPYRGKTNQPAYVPQVAAQLATIKGLSLEAVAAATSANARALFGLPAPQG